MFSKEFDFENVAQRKDGGISLSLDDYFFVSINAVNLLGLIFVSETTNIDISILCTYLSICTRLDTCKMSYKQINKLFKINKSL